MTGLDIIFANAMVFVIYFTVRRFFFPINIGFFGVLLIILPVAANYFSPISPIYLFASVAIGVFVLCFDIKRVVKSRVQN